MENFLSSAILGFVQGLTEFIPVSSSGHLVIFQSFLLPDGENVLFDALLHAGTLMATLLVFRNKIIEILTGFFQKSHFAHAESVAWIKWIIVGTLPTGFIGVFFKDSLEELFSAPDIVSIMLVVTGGILFATRYAKTSSRTVLEMTALQAILIGVMQGIAIIPGISRSGSTIAIALLIGVSRGTAGEFSFLLSLPAIAGAILLQLIDARHAAAGLSPAAMGFGVAIAFAIGTLSLSLLIRFIRKGHLHYFSYYCIFLGIIGTLYYRG